MSFRGRRTILLLLLSTRLVMAAPESVDDLVRDRKFPEALIRIRESLNKAQGDLKERLLLAQADCLVQLRQAEEAKKVLDQIDPRTAPAPFFRIRGQWQRLASHNSLARKDFAQALKLSSSTEERVSVLCELADLESEENHAKESEATWSQALEAASNEDAGPRVWGRVYRARYEFLTQHGRLQEGLDLARMAHAYYQAVNFPAGIFWSLLAEMSLLKTQGRFAEAELVWRRALAMEPRYRASALLAWGYQVLFQADDPPALRRILVEIDRNWSDQWTVYERYHVRMLQALIWLHGLGDPERTLTYLRLAEPLASPVPRPAGNHLSVSFTFHEFGDGPSSDVEQVLWLQLRCYKRLGRSAEETQKFMLDKVSSLPKKERPAWYFTLAKSYLPKQPQEAEKYFNQAMQGASVKVQSHLQRAMMDAYLDAGMVVPARKLARELGAQLDQLDSDEALGLMRTMLSGSLKLAWIESIWTGSLSSGAESLHAAVENELLSDPKRLEAMERAAQKREDEHRATGNKLLLSEDLRYKAQRLLAQDRLAEGVAACQVGRELCRDSGKSTASLDELLSYGLFRLGRRENALQTIDEARLAFSRSLRGSAPEEETECAVLEVAYLLEMQRPQPALELADQYLSRADDTEKSALELARARALVELKQNEEALKAFEVCEFSVYDSLYAVGVKCRRAMLLQTMERPTEALDNLRAALALAQEQHSVRQRDVVLLWHEIEPATAPLADTAQRLQSLLAELPPSYAAKIKSQRSTRYLMSLGGLNPGPESPDSSELLSRSEFLRESNELMLAEPKLATSVPVLPGSMVDMQERLPENEVLVEYYLGTHQTVIMLAGAEGFALRRLEVERATIEEWSRQAATDTSAAENLYRLLIDPVEKPCGQKTLVLLGHGPLLSLPWDLLRDADGSLLVQRHRWKLWAGEVGQPFPGLRHDSHILALGGVEGAELPASRREVQALSEAGLGQVQTLVGPEAGKDNLRREVGQADILHLATHSTPSFLQLSDGPLALSEIYGLGLKPGALVVLSSCEGAAPGEQERAPVTLAAAFRAAGASEVVASLQKVGDRESEEFFLEFYRALAQGKSPAEALRLAKLARLQANPKGDWWKFVLLGS